MRLVFRKRHGNRLDFERVLLLGPDDKAESASEIKPLILQLRTKTRRESIKDPKTGAEFSREVPDRTGTIYRASPSQGKNGEPVFTKGDVVWEGKVGSEGPPGRAFAVSAGLCRADGTSDGLPFPEWV